MDNEEYLDHVEQVIGGFREEHAKDLSIIDYQNPFTAVVNHFNLKGGFKFRIPHYLDSSWRVAELRNLKEALLRHKEEILEVMVEDYRMSKDEAELYEFEPVFRDLDNICNNFVSWSETKLDMTADDFGKDGELLTSVIGGFKSIFGIGNEGWIFNQPYGVVLVLGSKKSDLSSLLKPLFASIAAGNYTVIKPTERLVRSETDKLVIEILKKTLDPKRSFVVDRETDYDALISRINPDLVFTRKRDKENILTSICGKYGIPIKIHSAGWNVGVVGISADIKEAAEQLVHNKFYKSGQNVDNLDVIYVHENVYRPFLIEAKNALYRFYTSAGDLNMNYGKICYAEDYHRLLELLEDEEFNYETSIYHNETFSRINPILIKDPSPDSVVMTEKIFGPILPIRTFSSILDVGTEVNEHQHVENMFYFGNNTYLYEDVKNMFKYQCLYFNCTNLPLHSVDYTPDYGKDATMNSSLHGQFGFSTFSRQSLFYRARSPEVLLKKDFLKNEISYGKYGVGQTKWLSRARIGRFCLGVGFGSLLAKFI